MITQEELKKLFHYDPEIGAFIRIALYPSARGVKIGDIAGWISGNGYREIHIYGVTYKAHRLVWLYMTGEFPAGHIDHINHSRADNRFLNLRDATQADNNKNRRPQINNTSGITGVNWFKESSKWMSYITADNKRYHLGLYEDKFEAICVRKSAENRYGFHENHGH